MVDWEKGEHYEKQKWINKVNDLIDKFKKDNNLQYNKYVVIHILNKYLLGEEDSKCK